MTTPAPHTVTGQILLAMLLEDTDHHYAINRRKPPHLRPAVSLTGDQHEIAYRFNLYHWLLHNLDYRERLTLDFQAHCEGSAESHLCDMADWLEYKASYTPDMTVRPVTNTCNIEHNLSQDFQAQGFTIGTSCYLLLQTHNGCDARAGYTAPRVFAIDQDAWVSETSGLIACSCGASWECDGSEWISVEGDRNLEDYPRLPHTRKRKGIVRFDAQGALYCPVCPGKLEAVFPGY
jgi:hypothetical protein